MSSIVNLRQDSPLRPVNWRWEKAVALRTAGRQPTRLLDDQDIALAMEFQARYSTCRDDWDLVALSEEFPSILDAYEIYQGGGNAGASKSELEARLLARNTSIEEVAERIHTRLPVVRWYERLFFNVLDRRHNTSYLLHHAIGAKIHQSVNESDYDMLWKLFALCGGVHLLEDMMYILSNDLLSDTTIIERYRRKQTRSSVSRRALVSALTLRARDPHVKLQMMEIDAKYVEIESAMSNGLGGGGDDKMIEGMRAALESVKFLVADAAKNDLIGIAQHGVEPRADFQILARTSGDTDLPDMLARARYPQIKSLTFDEIADVTARDNS